MAGAHAHQSVGPALEGAAGKAMLSKIKDTTKAEDDEITRSPLFGLAKTRP